MVQDILGHARLRNAFAESSFAQGMRDLSLASTPE